MQVEQIIYWSQEHKLIESHEDTVICYSGHLEYSIILLSLFLKQQSYCCSYAFPFAAHGKSQITDIVRKNKSTLDTLMMFVSYTQCSQTQPEHVEQFDYLIISSPSPACLFYWSELEVRIDFQT